MVSIDTAYTLSECMDLLAGHVARNEANGEESIIFCEDRLTLIAEKKILSVLGGTVLSTVTTFSRYLENSQAVLSKQGSVMAIGKIMEDLLRKKELVYFNGTGIKRGAKNVYETIALLASSSVTSEILQESIDNLPQGSLRNKVSDICKIYLGYTEFLHTLGYVDESGYLALLPDKIRHDESIKAKNVIFLCYTSLTAQARETVRACADTVKSVVGIFCGGKEEIYTNKVISAFSSAVDDKCKITGKGIELGKEAEVLRKSLYAPEVLKTGYEPYATEKIRLFEGKNRYAEAEFVAVQIKKLLATMKGLRYRDLAVLVPDTSAYSLPIKRAFGEYGIPYFTDEKKTLKKHPLGAFLLSLFACVRDNSPERYDELLSNVFFGECDTYRNYLKKYANYRGGAKKEIKKNIDGYDISSLETSRKKLLDALAPIFPKATAKEYTDAIRKILKSFDAEKTLKTLSSSFSDVEQDGYLFQILPSIENILTELEKLVGNETLTLEDFETVFTDGLDATEISVIPMKADAVFVGDIEESRIEKVHTLFAMGLTSSVPRTTADTALISDREIRKLSLIHTAISPTVHEVNMRGRENVCLNLCTFSDGLFITFSFSDDDSEPSDIIRYLSVFYRDENGTRILKNRDIEKRYAPSDLKYVCSSFSPAYRKMLVKKKGYERHLENGEDFSSVYEALRLKNYLAPTVDETPSTKSVKTVVGLDKLYFKREYTSPTLLETYFDCPYKCFADKGLNLKEREENSVLATDTGNYIHNLLQKMSGRFMELSSESEVETEALKIGQELLASPIFEAQKETKSGEYMTQRLLKEGVEACKKAFSQIKGSKFVLKKENTEKWICYDEFAGKVDRVDYSDEYVRIIDYKTGEFDTSYSAYYTGRRLQLELYMLGAKEDKIPAGIFYFPASMNYVKASDKNREFFKMDGFMNGDFSALKAGDVGFENAKTESSYFNASIEKANDKMMDGATFDKFLQYAKLVSKKGVSEMHKGVIEASPYKDGCTYCKYGGMCGYDLQNCLPRKEEKIGLKEIVSIVDGEENKDE